MEFGRSFVETAKTESTLGSVETAGVAEVAWTADFACRRLTSRTRPPTGCAATSLEVPRGLTVKKKKKRVVQKTYRVRRNGAPMRVTKRWAPSHLLSFCCVTSLG
jgi:hypothetical protein